ncbi:MAG: hypothetical protein P1U47_08025 [Zhongshania sp.]|uniref:hypothetical protein n=1 Tax=Zhongshania sp. TaxID=1971902 RepID=UPI0026310BCF|nr:hypothetical protein [Zhongshania sp.]MDF1692304.1 hypothetical protein [Zhongshania sp.]
MRALLPLSFVFCFFISASAHAECAYPDSERGNAPDWLCGVDEFEGAGFLAVGDKSRLPSISLQNRIAGKAAMTAVVAKIRAFAAAQLQAELPADLILKVTDRVVWSQVARFKGIKVLDRVGSPQRHLYVLAGVAPELQAHMIHTARTEILKENKSLILAAIGQDGWRKLTAAIDKPMAETP